MTSVIIPAHNEERVLGRLLDGLLDAAEPGEFTVVVVSNGSTDRTVQVAQRAGVTVLDITQPSKHRALQEGDREAGDEFPRLYVDADIELDTAGARALVHALTEPGVLAVAPERDLRLDGSAWLVRAYYRAWQELPAVRTGLYGRGVLGVSREGFARIADRPDLIGDDLFLHSRFADGERRIVAGARSVVRGPRTSGDLLRRRIRAAQATTQLGERTRGATVTTGSSSKAIARLAARDPRLWPSVAVFVGVTAVARVRARRRPAGWLRDESSRA